MRPRNVRPYGRPAGPHLEARRIPRHHAGGRHRRERHPRCRHRSRPAHPRGTDPSPSTPPAGQLPILGEIARCGRALLNNMHPSRARCSASAWACRRRSIHEGGRVVGPSVMRRWDDFDIRGWLEKSLGIDALIDDDVNLMALSERISDTCGRMFFFRESRHRHRQHHVSLAAKSIAAAAGTSGEVRPYPVRRTRGVGPFFRQARLRGGARRRLGDRAPTCAPSASRDRPRANLWRKKI